ncbi:hypothetical protein SAMN05216489_07018 [Streptomyces sp. 3213]|uniref:hypothetical protein n=1 Tax=Streptomyces sp. 3213.3 TaxID=1855348 RepID=UPI0008998E0B|nr:hypothetical protein [Streptomyces sp. 3213.3]SEE53806.1 hypothetical protein SAMN05216489_07018 [Streptomyces sp. 3213] [Streptomyces sp. 3213.3]
MYEYEMHQLRSAELRRQAANERLAREAVRGARAARREQAGQAVESEVHTERPRRHLFARAS